jgi:hypothetical protein
MNSPTSSPVCWAIMGVRSRRRNGEGNAQEQVTGALLELEVQLSGLACGVRRDMELEHRVTGRQGHVRDLGHVPDGDDVAPTERVLNDAFDERVDPVDVPAAFVCRDVPVPPVMAVTGRWCRPPVPIRPGCARSCPGGF